MTRRTIAIAAFIAVAMAVACSEPPTTPPRDDQDAGGPGHPTEPSVLLLRVGYEGGFAPVDHQLTNLPWFSLYGDGTLVTPGPQIEIYPGPALDPIRRRTLTQGAVSVILRAASDAGLWTRTT